MPQPTASLRRIADFTRPTALGVDFKVTSFEYEGAILFALSRGELRHDGVLVRIQSPCLFGESFGVNSCDCGEQLGMALKAGAEASDFLLIYLSDQEGRSHGMAVKIQAIELEANLGMEMPETFRHLGLDLDLRQYSGAATIIRELVGDHSIRLLTNNPKKTAAMAQFNIKTERLPLVVPNPSPACRRYLASKRREMGHILPESYG